MNTDLPISIKLPEKFLEREVRCDFEVTAERKRVWAILLDELCAFKAVCDRHNLKWFMAAGSLLGAMRHGGFIPWDDDLDVSMPRADFDLFCKIAPPELPPNLFLQTSQSDSCYVGPFAKLRNSATCVIERQIVENKLRCHQGIGIDIFPMDGVPKADVKRRRIQFVLNILCRMHYRAVSCYLGLTMRSVFVSSFSKIIYGIAGTYFLKFREFILRIHTASNCDECCLILGDKKFMQKFKWPYALFEESMTAKFEGFTVKVPKRSDDYLSLSYGDWHKFVRDSSFHVDLVQKLYPNEKFTTILIKDYGYKRGWLKRWMRDKSR